MGRVVDVGGLGVEWKQKAVTVLLFFETLVFHRLEIRAGPKFMRMLSIRLAKDTGFDPARADKVVHME